MNSPSASSRPAGHSAEPSLDQWERLTRRANDAFLAAQFAIAISAHAQALWVAEALIGSEVLSRRPDDCLAALIVSHHNLADLYRDAGHPAAAAEHLCRPHLTLVELLQDPHFPIPVQQAALRHLRETRTALIAHARAHGSDGAIGQALQTAAMPLRPPGVLLH